MKHAIHWFLGLLSLTLTTPLLAQPALDKWVTDLEQGDAKTRREAAYQLHQLGREALPALPALIKALDDREQQVWFHSIMTIALLGPQAESAIPKLMEGLQSGRRRSENQEWYRSAYALGCIGPAALPALREALSSDNPSRRSGAAKAMGFIGSAAASAIPDLVILLADREETVRRTVVETLGLIGPAAVEPLRQALQAEERVARATAVQALGEIGAPAKAAEEQLAALAKNDPAAPVRAQAIEALQRIGYNKLLPIALEAFQRDNSEDQEAAIDVLLLSRPPEKTVVPALIPLLQSSTPPVRERAAYVLGRLGPPAAAAVPDLIKAADAISEKKEVYTRALAEVGPRASPALLQRLGSLSWEAIEQDWSFASLSEMKQRTLAALTDALTDPNPKVRYAALGLLEALGKEARPAQSGVVERVTDPDPHVRARAIHTFLALDVSLDPIRPRLFEFLKDPDAAVRAAAALSMGKVGNAASMAVPALLDLSNDPDPSVAVVAVQTLGQITVSETEAAARRLVPKLAAEHRPLRLATVETLGRLGSGSRVALEPLAKMTAQTNDSELRLAAIVALGHLRVKETIPTLQGLSKDAAPEVRAAAISALGRLEDKEVLGQLIGALQDENSKVCQSAAEAIGGLGADGREATDALFEMLAKQRNWEAALDAARAIQVTSVPRLIEILQSPEPSIRLFACERLRALGPDAKEALPALRPLLEDKYDFIKEAAKRAVRRLEQQ